MVCRAPQWSYFFAFETVAGASAEEILAPQPEPVAEEVKVEGTDASQPF